MTTLLVTAGTASGAVIRATAHQEKSHIPPGDARCKISECRSTLDRSSDNECRKRRPVPDQVVAPDGQNRIYQTMIRKGQRYANTPREGVGKREIGHQGKPIAAAQRYRVHPAHGSLSVSVRRTTIRHSAAARATRRLNVAPRLVRSRPSSVLSACTIRFPTPEPRRRTGTRARPAAATDAAGERRTPARTPTRAA